MCSISSAGSIIQLDLGAGRVWKGEEAVNMRCKFCSVGVKIMSEVTGGGEVRESGGCCCRQSCGTSHCWGFSQLSGGSEQTNRFKKNVDWDFCLELI